MFWETSRCTCEGVSAARRSHLEYRSASRPIHRRFMNRIRAARRVRAGDWPTALPVRSGQADLTGEQVLQALDSLFARYGRTGRYHFLCGRRCFGKSCHGRHLLEVARQVFDATEDPPFPKELKPTLTETMSDMAVLLHVSFLTGLPVYQIGSDVKDFFNQKRLSPTEMPKVGLVTLDSTAVVEYAASLRRDHPHLSRMAEAVLGFGYYPASNICQREMLLLIFIWHVEMARAAASTVLALCHRYPAIEHWLARRRQHLEGDDFSKDPTLQYRFAQAKLWVMNGYTDDTEQIILGVDLTIIGLRVWHRITSRLRLEMAIIQKHSIGSTLTYQGIRFNSVLGVAYVPTDKLRRALRTLSEVAAGTVTVADYRSVLGLLQSMLVVVGMRRSSTYGMYTPFAGTLDIDEAELLKATPVILTRCREWVEHLLECAGSSVEAAVDMLMHDGRHPLPPAAPALFFLRSDACTSSALDTSDTTVPGLGGNLGGALWTHQLTTQQAGLPIAVLEFAAAVVTLELFAPELPAGALVLFEVDALATMDALTTDSAHSPLMQHLHRHLLASAAYRHIAPGLLCSHVYGDANLLADAASRSRMDVARSFCAQMGMAMEIRTTPPSVSRLLDELVGLQRLEPAAKRPCFERRRPDPPARSNLAVAASSMDSTSVNLGLAADSLARPDFSFRAGASVPTPSHFGFAAPPATPPRAFAPSVAHYGTPSSKRLFVGLDSATSQPKLPRVQHSAPTLAPSEARPTLSLAEVASAGQRNSLLADHVAGLLCTDSSPLALRPLGFSLHDLCARLYDPITAQPASTSKGQASAWKHWTAWCHASGTNPWRLEPVATATDRHREAVLQAGFLRFCHLRQSARARDGRTAALPSSASKTLAHIRKMHKDRSYPMASSGLVQTELRRLHFEYKNQYGVASMVPKRKEPFTRHILLSTILGAPSGFVAGRFRLQWDARSGRSLCALTLTLASTGFRKGEVCVESPGQACDADCLSRASLQWFLRGKMYGHGSQNGPPPPDLLSSPRVGDFAVLTPPPSKSDPFDMVWGGSPIWLPFVADEPLCAFPALAAIEIRDPIGASAAPSTALFTQDTGLPFYASQLDTVLRALLMRDMPEATAKLYSWHSARIYLATSLLAAGVSPAEIQAMCRWQTPQSLLIYARLGMAEYGALVQRAHGSQVTAARANNLNAALPFLCWEDVQRATLARLTADPPAAAPATPHGDSDLRDFAAVDLDADPGDYDADVDGDA